VTTAQVRKALTQIGFGAQSDALVQFQAGAGLIVDGKVGPKTAAALNTSVANGGKCSRNYRYRDFMCRHCGVIVMDIELVRALEAIAAKFRKYIVISGFRCAAHNAAIGGAKGSLHTQRKPNAGQAADIDTDLTVTQVRTLRVARGIEWDTRTRKVKHIDTDRRFTTASPNVFGWPHS